MQQTGVSASLASSAFQFSRSSLLLVFFCFGASLWAQNQPTAQALRPLITSPIDESRLTTLKGNTHPLAKAIYDVGSAPATMPMQRMLLVLKRGPQQEAALRTLLDEQQDKASSNYHQWLTPEQFGRQFGPTDDDIQKITAWLQSHGFEVGTTKGRSVLEFSGTAAQVKEAFHTSIHKYVVHGEQHWANSSDPQIPSALAPAVAGIDSLHNFGRKRMSHFVGVTRREKATGKFTVPQPQFTFPVSASNACNAQDTNCYVVGPYDFATIYSVLSLWNTVPTAIDGTGQRIGIVQDSNIDIADANAFRAMFNLPANPPNIIVSGPDPGPLNAGSFGGESEADLDVEWSGAVAKGATIDLVVSADTDTTAGIDLSAFYLVENNADAVISESFGLCEAFLGTSGNQFYNSMWEQAAAQGISVFVAAGDEGSAACDVFQGTPPQPAVDGLEVSGIASTPFNVAVGGTDFQDVNNPTTYWNPTNDLNQASAKSYIPETVWNDTCTNALFAEFKGGSTNAETNCNNANFVDFVSASGGSGGPSNCSTSTTDGTTISCVSGTAKPSWQSFNGVPNDQARDIPDVSLFASNGFQGNFYVYCQGDLTPSGSCDLNAPYADFGGVGGTSASSPAMAGIMAMVDQFTNSRQGNPNYVLYKLAASVPAAFNDVTNGTNRVPCQTGSLDCTTSVSTDAYGIINGYDAGTGFDLATGLGSVNASSLVTNWSSVTFTHTTTTLTLNNGTAVNVTHGSAVPVLINVAATSGTPTGDVSLIDADTNQAIDAFTLSAGSVSGNTSQLLGGTYHVKAHYAGDGTFAASDSATPYVSVTVTAETSSLGLSVETVNSSGQVAAFSSGPFGSFVYVKATVTGSSGEAALCQSAQSTGFPTFASCPTGGVTFVDSVGAIPAATQCTPTPSGGTCFNLNSEGDTSIANGNLVFDQGTHNISATYPGDSSFGSGTASASFTIQPGIALVSGLGSVTVSAPGGNGTTTVSIITSSGLSGSAVTFSCAGATETTCSGSATSKGPNTPVNAKITVTTTGPHTTMLRSKERPFYCAMLLGGSLPLAGIFLIGGSRRRRCSTLLGLMLLMSVLVVIPGCGGGGSSQQQQQQQDPGTPAGTYNLAVTAASGSVSQQIGTLTLVVQ